MTISRATNARRFRAFGLALLALFAWTGACGSAQAVVVRFSSPVGNILVRLYHTRTPQTTQNFLNYTDGEWVDTFIHRSIPGFVVQGGGFTFTSNATGVADVPSGPMVINEPGISNLRGTIAMAKLAPPEEGGPPNGGPNSATNQWFFSLANNASNLDNQNGGFTVFGRVVGNGMTVVDAIAALPRVNASGGDPNGVFANLPVRNFSGGNIFKENLVTFTSIAAINIPAGDYDFNGLVNAADLAVLKADFGSTTKAEADGNGDGIVNAADFLVWQRTLGQNVGAPGLGAIGAVPEPGTIVLAAIALAVAGRIRRHLVAGR